MAIIIPVYNRLDLLKETLESVRSVDGTQWECLLVDDGSEAEVIKYMHEWCLAHSQFRFLEAAGGIRGANRCRNIGMQETSAEQLVFLDSDDLVSPGLSNSRLAAVASHPDVDFLVFPGCSFERELGNNARFINRRDPAVADAVRFLQFDFPWHTSSVLWKRSSLLALGGWDEQMACHQDIELHLRVLSAGLSYEWVDGSPDFFFRLEGKDRSRLSSGMYHKADKCASKIRLLQLLFDAFQGQPERRLVQQLARKFLYEMSYGPLYELVPGFRRQLSASADYRPGIASPLIHRLAYHFYLHRGENVLENLMRKAWERLIHLPQIRSFSHPSAFLTHPCEAP